MAATTIANRKTAPRLVKTDEPSIAERGLVELDYLSANLMGARAILTRLDNFEQSDELLYLLYLLEFAEERAEKARLIFDESVRALERGVAHA